MWYGSRSIRGRQEHEGALPCMVNEDAPVPGQPLQGSLREAVRQDRQSRGQETPQEKERLICWMGLPLFYHVGFRIGTRRRFSLFQDWVCAVGCPDMPD